LSRKREGRDHPPLYLDGVIIARPSQHKHLGLTIVQDLTWGVHINEIVDKANRRLGILRNLKYKVNRLCLEKIYKAYIRPILEYGDIIWDGSPNDILSLLDQVQHNAARIVIGATAKCSTEGLYRETAWETLQGRRHLHRLSLMYNIVNRKAPQYLIEQLPNLIEARTTYSLRNRGDIDPIRSRINLYANSFFPKTVSLWNNLDREVKSLPSIGAFQANRCRRLPQRNPLYYFGGRLEAAIHARMRINNSPLKDDLCKWLHVIPSSLCPCGTGEVEDAKHFFYKCRLFDQEREILMANLLPYIIRERDFLQLLYGIPDADHLINIHIFGAVHQFIRSSKRFY
jgi:hypothetical protein